MPIGELNDIRVYPSTSGNEWGFLTEEGSGKTQIYWRKPGQDLPSLKKGDRVEFSLEKYNMEEPSGKGGQRLIEVAIITKLV